MVHPLSDPPSPCLPFAGLTDGYTAWLVTTPFGPVHSGIVKTSHSPVHTVCSVSLLSIALDTGFLLEVLGFNSCPPKSASLHHVHQTSVYTCQLLGSRAGSLLRTRFSQMSLQHYHLFYHGSFPSPASPAQPEGRFLLRFQQSGWALGRP